MKKLLSFFALAFSVKNILVVEKKFFLLFFIHGTVGGGTDSKIPICGDNISTCDCRENSHSRRRISDPDFGARSRTTALPPVVPAIRVAQKQDPSDDRSASFSR